MTNMTREEILEKEKTLEQEFIEICGPLSCGDYESYEEFHEAIKGVVNTVNPEIDDYINIQSYTKDWWDDFWFDYQHGEPCNDEK